MILLDTSGLLANYDKSDRSHTAAARVLARPDRRLLSPFVLAELDYLVTQIAGQAAELAVLEDVARGAYQLEWFGAADVAAPEESSSNVLTCASGWPTRPSRCSPSATPATKF